VLLEAIVAAQHRCNFMPFISLFDESILSSRQAARSSGESARRRQVRVDLAPDIRRGEACDFRNRFRVQTLEIRHDHLAVERIELLDQSEQSAERLGTVRRTFNVFGTRVALGLFQGQKGSYTLALGLADDVRCRHVMRHTVGPGSNRAPPVELRQAAPQRQMDFLRKLPTQFRRGLFGIVPALRRSRVSLEGLLKQGAQEGGAGAGSVGARDFLVVTEVTLALSLLIVCGLLIRVLAGFLLTKPGFNPQNLLRASISVADSRYPTFEARYGFGRGLIEQVNSLPGVKSSALESESFGHAPPQTSHLPRPGSGRVHSRHSPWSGRTISARCNFRFCEGGPSIRRTTSKSPRWPSSIPRWFANSGRTRMRWASAPRRLIPLNGMRSWA